MSTEMVMNASSIQISEKNKNVNEMPCRIKRFIQQCR